MYAARVFQYAPVCLKVLIRGNAANPNSWAAVLRDDLVWLRDQSEAVASCLPIVDEDSIHIWEQYMQRQQSSLAAMVKEVVRVYEVGSKLTFLAKAKHAPIGSLVQCQHCVKCFEEGPPMTMHLIKMHRYRAPYSVFADAPGDCRWCGKHFHCRVRLKAHLRVGLQKKNCGSCFAQMRLWQHVPVPPEDLAVLDLIDAATTSLRKLKGVSWIHSDLPVCQGLGPLRQVMYGPLPADTELRYVSETAVIP
jgi:hypothetical protein